MRLGIFSLITLGLSIFSPYLWAVCPTDGIFDPAQVELFFQESQTQKTRQDISLPLAYRGAYGCNCPEVFIGTQSMEGAGKGLWVHLVYANKIKKPVFNKDMGKTILARGYFTGKTLQEKHDETSYNLKEFVITKIQDLTVNCDSSIIETLPQECCLQKIK